jgi:hypothetical protein
MKAGQGDPDWLRLFKLMSHEIMLIEGCPADANRDARLDEIVSLNGKLDAVQRLEDLRQAPRGPPQVSIRRLSPWRWRWITLIWTRRWRLIIRVLGWCSLRGGFPICASRSFNRRFVVFRTHSSRRVSGPVPRSASSLRLMSRLGALFVGGLILAALVALDALVFVVTHVAVL